MWVRVRACPREHTYLSVTGGHHFQLSLGVFLLTELASVNPHVVFVCGTLLDSI